MAPLGYPVPENEGERLAELRRYDVLDTPPEPEFDDIVKFAADLFHAPIALVSLVGDRHQSFKARVGLEACETSRTSSFCAHALVQPDVLVVPDAHEDERFRDNPLVVGPPYIRFYAGAPLVTPAGQTIGAVCIIDTVPRAGLSEQERGYLRHLARLAMNQLDKRRLLQVREAALRLAGATPDAIICADEAGRITFWNAAAERAFGRTRAEVLGSAVEIILPSLSRSERERLTGQAAGRPGPHARGSRFEVQGRRPDGSEVPVELTLAEWGDPGARQVGAIIRDVSERNQAREWVDYLSHFDRLTSLPNRARFMAAISEALARAPAFALVKVALDRFKQVNATLGMGTGDEILRQSAERIAALAPAGSLVGRLGGDEFGILLPGCADEGAASEVTKALLGSVEQPFDVFGNRLVVGASAGIFVNAGSGSSTANDADSALVAALLALQVAKLEGGGHYQAFRPALASRASERRRLEEELRAAFERSEFELHYQPQYWMSDHRLVGAEALLRWRHPEHGLLAPAAFLDVLETSPQAVAVGRWIIDTAAALSGDLARRGSPTRVGVNLFAGQLVGGDLAEVVASALSDHALDPALLELEITERTALTVDEDAIGPLRRVRNLGVGIAFDDYGTGYASLSLLKRYPLTRLKIDREFVRNLESDPDDAAIVRAVLTMGRSLGLHVTAEGIETRAQAEFLRAHGCDEAQGYLFSRPLPERDLRALLRREVALAA